MIIDISCGIYSSMSDKDAKHRKTDKYSKFCAIDLVWLVPEAVENSENWREKKLVVQLTVVPQQPKGYMKVVKMSPYIYILWDATL